MNVNSKSWIKLTISFLLALVFSQAAFANSGVTYHGRLLKPVAQGGGPVTSMTTQFRIQILSPNNCLLWEEWFQRDLSNSDGVFTITINDSTGRIQTNNVNNVNTGANFRLDEIFSNRYNLSSLTGCSVGTTYNPNSSDGRILRAYFRELPGDPWDLMPEVKVNFVPLALNSVQLDGYTPSEFLKIDGASSYTPLTTGQVNTLMNIITGTGSPYVKTTDNLAGDVSGTPGANTVDRIKGTSVSGTAPTTGQVLKYNGTTWAPAADDTGTAAADASYSVKGLVQINTDQATSGLYIASGVLALPNTITAGSAGSAQQVPAITYDNKGRITAVTPTTIDDTTKLPLAGGTMSASANINMNNGTITNAASVSATSASLRNVVLNGSSSGTITIQPPATISPNVTLTLPNNDGNSGEVLTTDGSGALSWAPASTGLPSQATHAGKFLTTNGTSASWSADIVTDTEFAAYVSPVTGTSCANNQTIYWNSVGNAFACRNVDVALAGAFVDGGNSFGQAGDLGTNDNYALNFRTNNSTKASILADGKFGIGMTTPSELFQVGSAANSYFEVLAPSGAYIAGSQIKVRPAGATDNASIGVDAGHLQIAGANNGVVSLENASNGAVTQFDFANKQVTFKGAIKIEGGTPGAGKILTSDAAGLASWTAGSTYVSQTAYNTDVGSATCTNVQTAYWSSGLDQWLCQNISASGIGAVVDGGNSFSQTMDIGTNDNNDLVFKTNSTNRFYITAAGKYGFGDPSPLAKFSVAVDSPAAKADDDITLTSFSNTQSPFYNSVRARGTASAPAALQNGDWIGGISGTGFDGSAWQLGSSVILTADSNFNSSISSGITLQTINAGTPVNAVVVSKEGNVGIGTSPNRALTVVSSDTTNWTTQPSDVSISSSNTIGAGITLRPTSSGSYSNGWTVYAGSSASLIGDGSFGIWNNTTTGAKFMINQAGDAGIGTTSAPRAKLDVNGAIVSKPALGVTSGSTVDFASNNMAYSTMNCKAYAIHNLKDGGTYTLVIQGTTSATCSFTVFSDSGSTSLGTAKMPPDHGATTAGKQTMYTFMNMGGTVYVGWIPGY